MNAMGLSQPYRYSSLANDAKPKKVVKLGSLSPKGLRPAVLEGDKVGEETGSVWTDLADEGLDLTVSDGAAGDKQTSPALKGCEFVSGFVKLEAQSEDLAMPRTDSRPPHTAVRQESKSRVEYRQEAIRAVLGEFASFVFLST